MGQVCPFALALVHVKRHDIHPAEILPTQLASSLKHMVALLAASADGIDLGRLLLDLTLMLVMAKVAAEIAGSDSNIDNVTVAPDSGDQYATMNFTLQVANRVHLAKIMRSLRSIPEVVRITRSKD